MKSAHLLKTQDFKKSLLKLLGGYMKIIGPALGALAISMSLSSAEGLSELKSQISSKNYHCVFCAVSFKYQSRHK